jgi:MscS family membrane protein
VLITLQTLGVSVTGVMAFGGIGGIAIGFAAKDLLANFFGGMMIYLDRPFTEGDWIRSPDKDIEGTVENIGWRLTCIRRFNKRPLYVPNSIFASIAVENPSRMLNRQINETIGIRYDDIGKMADIVSDVKSMLRNHEEIDQDQTMIVNFNAFNASSVDFFIYTFTKTTQWIRFHEIKQEILLKVAEIIDQHGAEIAFPTQTLHMHQASPEPEPLNPTLNEGKA